MWEGRTQGAVLNNRLKTHLEHAKKVMETLRLVQSQVANIKWELSLLRRLSVYPIPLLMMKPYAGVSTWSGCARGGTCLATSVHPYI